MSWLYLILAGCGEVAGVTAMKYFTDSKKKTFLLALIIAFAFSFSLLSLAMIAIPMSTAYAIWTGIGTVGSVLLGTFLFHEAINLPKISFICLIIAGAIGLKLLG